MFVVHVAFNEKAFIISSEFYCAQVRSFSSSSSSPPALHQGQIQTHNTCTCGDIINGSWFLTNSKAKPTLHHWNKLHKVLNFCQILSSQVSKDAFYLRATVRTYLRTLSLILKSIACQTGYVYQHRRNAYYVREQFITCSNNQSKSKRQRIALSRACTDALAFIEHKPVVW